MKFAVALYFASTFIVLNCISVKAQQNYVPYRQNSLPSRHGYLSGSPTFNYYGGDLLEGRRVVCLYNINNYAATGFTPSSINSTICTHINYEFAILDPKTYEMIPGEPNLDIRQNFYIDVVNLKKQNPSLKVILSMGGWEDSTKKYSELVESHERMDNFVDKAIPFLKTYGFDGLDVAWEYPNCWKGALGISPNDKKNFVVFLQKLRQRFDAESFTLSISVGAVKREILAAYDGPAVSNAVHHVNVMTYDMHGPWDHVTGHHAQFDKADGDDDPFLNAKNAMEIWANLGVEKKKLNMGIPTYAKTFTLVDPTKNGIGAPTKGAGKPGPISNQRGFMCFNEICQLLNNGSWIEAEDRERGYYAYSNDQWASYDTPSMVVKKARWVAQNGYGGVLIKDCSCDDHEGRCISIINPLMIMAKMEMIHVLD